MLVPQTCNKNYWRKTTIKQRKNQRTLFLWRPLFSVFILFCESAQSRTFSTKTSTYPYFYLVPFAPHVCLILAIFCWKSFRRATWASFSSKKNLAVSNLRAAPFAIQICDCNGTWVFILVRCRLQKDFSVFQIYAQILTTQWYSRLEESSTTSTMAFPNVMVSPLFQLVFP